METMMVREKEEQMEEEVDLVRTKRSLHHSSHSYYQDQEYTGGDNVSTITSESSSEFESSRFHVIEDKVVANTHEEFEEDYEQGEGKSVKIHEVDFGSHEKVVHFNANQGTESENGHSKMGQQPIPLPPTQRTSNGNQQPQGLENTFLSAKASLKLVHYYEPKTLNHPILPTEGFRTLINKPTTKGNITKQEEATVIDEQDPPVIPYPLGEAEYDVEKVVEKQEEATVIEQDGPVIPDQLVEAEYDVKKVLEKQESHDLYCPNCNSCITKRVILKRRKRKVHDFSTMPEEDISEAAEVSDVPVDLDVTEETSQTAASIDRDETKRDAFTCLSCFSIFIPTGNGFKFWFKGDKRKDQTTQRPKYTPVVDTILASSSSVAHPNMPTDNVKPDPHIGVGDASEVSSGLIDVPDEPSLLPDADQNPVQDPFDDTDTVAPPLQQPAKGEASVVAKPTPAPGTGDVGSADVVIPMPDERRADSITTPVNETEEVAVPLLPSPSAVAAERVERDGFSGVDIIKAIIYGGMMEMIASLSVVTSAAGADAATLKILALGAANVFGGLFVLAHNLRLLKHETSIEHYEAKLGKIGHFALHATVAVISYLVFGLMPPIVYAFSFRGSDNGDYKLAVVGSAALFCIILLSLAKAHLQSPPTYCKTLSYYVTLGVMACGVSYLVGDLFEILLQKLGWFESSSSVFLFVPKAGIPWTS